MSIKRESTKPSSKMFMHCSFSSLWQLLCNKMNAKIIKRTEINSRTKLVFFLLLLLLSLFNDCFDMLFVCWEQHNFHFDFGLNCWINFFQIFAWFVYSFFFPSYELSSMCLFVKKIFRVAHYCVVHKNFECSLGGTATKQNLKQLLD